MKVSLQNITPDIERNIVEIARVSSSRKDKTEDVAPLINYLIKNNHWSPFEHGFLTFEIETSKAIAIQLLRHRSNYFQEFSQRYQDVNKISDDGIFEEIELREQAETNRQSSTNIIATGTITKSGWDYIGNHEHPAYNSIIKALDALVRLDEAYEEMIEQGVAKECARFFLPMCTKTRLYVTMNVRSVIHWLDLRDDSHAQKEIQLIAREVKEIVKEFLPLISSARGYN